MRLTDEQLAVLNHTNKPALVTAGAGTGKTTVLTQFIAQKLLKHGASKNILVLTFSNAACEELKERIDQQLQAHGLKEIAEYSNLTIKTYDAFGFSLIRKHHKKLGYQKTPKLIEDNELFQECVSKVVRLHLKKNGTYQQLSENEQKSVKKSLEKGLTKELALHKKRVTSGEPTDKFLDNKPLVKDVLEIYKKEKRSQNFLDFEDMVGPLMKNNGQLLIESARDYHFLLVDELQDTSVKQAQMLIVLAKNIKTTMMVGDPKQNINVFRGAFAKNWDTIKDKLKPIEYSLTKSQRIPARSLSFVNAIGDEIYPGSVLISDVKGQPTLLIRCESIAEQAQFIADEINRLIAKGINPKEIACLGRTKRSLSNLTVALEGHGILTHEQYRAPYKKHAIYLRNLLRLVRSLQDVISVKGFEFPKKRRKAFTTVLQQLGLEDQEIKQIFKNIPRLGWNAVRVKSKILDRNKDKQNPKYRSVLDFRNLITKAAQAKEPEKAISYLMDALRKVLNKHTDRRNLGYLMRDLTQLKIKIRQFSSFEDLRVLKLQLNHDPNGVQLSTINGAKGKEWRYVFVIHCVEGFIPIHYAKTNQELDSEKMLFYVAITRHKQGLYLMDAPGSIVIYNGGKKKNQRLDKEFLDRSSFITPHEKHLKVIL